MHTTSNSDRRAGQTPNGTESCSVNGATVGRMAKESKDSTPPSEAGRLVGVNLCSVCSSNGAEGPTGAGRVRTDTSKAEKVAGLKCMQDSIEELRREILALKAAIKIERGCTDALLEIGGENLRDIYLARRADLHSLEVQRFNLKLQGILNAALFG